MLKEHADCLAAPLASIFNCSLREGVLPNVWKSANIIPLPKTKPLMSVNTDIIPISITPIAAKVFESIIMKYVDDIVCDTIDSKQLGGYPFNGPLSGTKYPTRAASPIQNASTPKSSLPFSKHRSCALLCTVVRRF